MDKKFNGWCELANTLMIIVSILAACCCNYSPSNVELKSFIAVLISLVTIIFDILKIFYMAFIGSADRYEVIIIVISLIFICCAFDDFSRHKICNIIPVLFVTIITGFLETCRDVQAFTDKDGSDCLF